MALPYFFVPALTDKGLLTLDEETSKHIISVLRMQKGEELLLTNGQGLQVRATIIDDHRKHCSIQIRNASQQAPKEKKVAIGISLIKNIARFEWFLEKATEIGVSEIFPLICARTERDKFRPDRLQQIVVSALLQSQQVWLPILHEPVKPELLPHTNYPHKYIAHCREDSKHHLPKSTAAQNHSLILIGPEGDFTQDEISWAIRENFLPVSLGATRLRTETAGIVAATLLCIE